MVFTVFVNNLLQRVNARWVYTVFGKFWKVIDVFIPQKMSRWGRKIGFVRYAVLNEAKRAVCNLNGVFFLDYKIGVNLAKYDPRKAFWKKSEKE
ncbi:hypothetical protein REPUB_Repub11eG0029100 [Reevesia pubescens]